MLEFKTINLKYRDKFNELLLKTEYENSEFSFANIFIWSKAYDIQLCMKEEVIYISAVIPQTKKYVHFQPIFSDNSKLSMILDEIKKDIEFHGEVFCIAAANKLFTDLIKERFPKYKINEAREMYDYIYLTTDLSNLEGKKYRKKRTNINNFKNVFNYEYKKMDNDNKADCIKIFDKWNENIKDDVLDEKNSILSAIENLDELELFGALIYIKDEPIAFTIAESFKEDTVLIHIEKAVPEYRSAYTIINQEFAERELLGKFKFINREEDMGIEGIKRAKLSYHPCKLVGKYDICEE